MTLRLFMANKSGKVINELEVDVESISWRLNDIGKMTFNIAKTDSKMTSGNLAFGNLCLVEFENGLPNWGGIIDPPRVWHEATVQVTAYSGEYLLGFRQTDIGRYFSGASVGAIYQAIIQEAPAGPAYPIEIGEIWGGGIGHSPEYHFENLFDIAQDSLTKKLSTADFDLTPILSGNNITFLANLYERKGSDKTKVALIEGHNLTDIKLNEQGLIINSWDLAGEGQSWDADVRLTSHAEDVDSIAYYGLRQGSKIYTDVKVQGTLDAYASNILAESKDPHNMLDVTAADLAPASFSDYDVGDSVKVQLHSFGFDGFDAMVRVIGREYDPNSNTCKLVVREAV